MQRLGGAMLPADCLTVFEGFDFGIALFLAFFGCLSWYYGLGFIAVTAQMLRLILGFFLGDVLVIWLRGQDLNLRPSGYEPDELPGCSTPRYQVFAKGKIPLGKLQNSLSVLGKLHGSSSEPAQIQRICRDDVDRSSD
jgi:hypothetical protein